MITNNGRVVRTSDKSVVLSVDGLSGLSSLQEADIGALCDCLVKRGVRVKRLGRLPSTIGRTVSNGQSRTVPAKGKVLSTQETRVLNLAAAGYLDKEIATEMGLEVATIRTYWDRLRKKLQASNRAHAICVALAQGRIKL